METPLVLAYDKLKLRRISINGMENVFLRMLIEAGCHLTTSTISSEVGWSYEGDTSLRQKPTSFYKEKSGQHSRELVISYKIFRKE